MYHSMCTFFFFYFFVFLSLVLHSVRCCSCTSTSIQVLSVLCKIFMLNSLTCSLVLCPCSLLFCLKVHSFLNLISKRTLSIRKRCAWSLLNLNISHRKVPQESSYWSVSVSCKSSLSSVPLCLFLMAVW